MSKLPDVLYYSDSNGNATTLTRDGDRWKESPPARVVPGRESGYHPRCFRCDAPMRINRNDKRRGTDLVCEGCRKK